MGNNELTCSGLMLSVVESSVKGRALPSNSMVMDFIVFHPGCSNKKALDT